MYYSVNNIYNGGCKGIKRSIPNLNWRTICDNINFIANNFSNENRTSVIRKLLKGEVTDDGRILASHRDTKFLSYIYLAKNHLENETILQELDILINQMTTKSECICTDRANERITLTDSWSAICPNIQNITELREVTLRSFSAPGTIIVYCNSTIPDKLLKFYETATQNKVTKINETTYLAVDHYDNSKILLLSDIYDEKSLDLLLYNVLLETKEHYIENFTTVPYDANKHLSADDKVNRLNKLFERAVSAGDLRALNNLNSTISRMFTQYQLLITQRNKIVDTLNNAVDNINNFESLVKTLDKMSDNISWDCFDKYLSITCTTPIFNYDESLIKRMFSNGAIDRIARSPWIKKLLEDCFINNSKQFMTTTEIYVNIIDNTVRCSSKYSEFRHYGEEFFHNIKRYMKAVHMPNPHIARFNCWGQNGGVLVQLLKDKKWEEFVYCLQATLGNLNFNDAIVLEHLILLLEDAPDDYVVAKDTETGKLITIKEIKEGIVKEDEKN